MESQDILKSFTKKLIDYLFYSNRSTLKQSVCKNSEFQIKTPVYPHVHSEIDYIWEDFSTEPKSFSVEISEQLENCAPLLLERWNFKITTVSPNQVLQSYHELSGIMRSLIGFCMILPSSTIFPKALSIRDSHLNTQWPDSLSNSEILQFPIKPYQLFSSNINLTIDVQYYKKLLRPKLVIQDIGERPRMLSVGSIDNSPSLHERKLSYVENKPRTLSNYINDTIYEEDEVGIKLISSEYFDDSEPFGENFGPSCFELEIEISEASNTPEEAKVSLYLISCEKVKNIKIFNESGDFDIRMLVDKWRSNENFGVIFNTE